MLKGILKKGVFWILAALLLGMAEPIIYSEYVTVQAASSAVERHTKSAYKYFHKGKFDLAIKSAKKAIDADPDNAGEAWYWLALSYENKREIEKIRSALKRVLELEHGFFSSSALEYHAWSSYVLGGLSAYTDNDFDEALTQINKALEFVSHHKKFILRRCNVYLLKGLYREALRDCNLVVSNERASNLWSQAYRSIAFVYLGLGDKSKAFSSLHKSDQALLGQHHNETYNKAMIYYALGEEKNLNSLLSEAGYLGIEYKEYTGSKYKRLRAIEIISVVKNSPAEQAGLQQGDIIIKANNQGGLEFMYKVHNLAPGSIMALQVDRKRKKKEISIVLGSFEQAFNKTEVEKNPFIVPFMLKRRMIEKADLAEQNGELRNAFHAYLNYLRDKSKRPIEYEHDIIERIIKLYRRLDPPPAIPEDARRHTVKAEFYIKDAKTDEDYQRANAEFEQAAKIAPWWADTYFNKAIAQQQAGDDMGAIRSFKLFLLAAPDDPAVGDVRNTIYTLEAKVEKYAEVKRWEGKWLNVGTVLRFKTIGNAATMVYIKVNQTDYNKGHRPGLTRLSGTISGNSLRGKLIKRTGDANTTRCFGKEYEMDVTGQLSPDSQTIKLQYKSETFFISTCAIADSKEATMVLTRIP